MSSKAPVTLTEESCAAGEAVILPRACIVTAPETASSPTPSRREISRISSQSRRTSAGETTCAGLAVASAAPRFVDGLAQTLDRHGGASKALLVAADASETAASKSPAW